MTSDYQNLHQHLQARLAQLSGELPGPMSGFSRLHNKAIENGALDKMTKEHMALAISIAMRCEGCIAYHTHDSVEAGATRAEVLETLGLAIMMGGGPATVYAAYAMDAIDQFLPASAAS